MQQSSPASFVDLNDASACAELVSKASSLALDSKLNSTRPRLGWLASAVTVTAAAAAVLLYIRTSTSTHHQVRAGSQSGRAWAVLLLFHCSVTTVGVTRRSPAEALNAASTVLSPELFCLCSTSFVGDVLEQRGAGVTASYRLASNAGMQALRDHTVARLYVAAGRLRRSCNVPAASALDALCTWRLGGACAPCTCRRAGELARQSRNGIPVRAVMAHDRARATTSWCAPCTGTGSTGGGLG